ncbi:hypothetical protein JKF63_03290 [Porcisia hertigi]|uniref:EXPERA domain-containing protein n=1 Tax=Porcisia hertigi TaxID=2761500 RepID=A0A836IMX1_9TRYP|nr:hypothetical protein JKF63_03290 [Porcisia hertigi]
MPQATLSLLAKVWFLAVTPICVVDSIFVFTRAKSVHQPHPLAEMVPFKYWTIYAQYDRRYAANDDVFVVVQSLLNLLEVTMGLFVVLLAFCNARNLSIKLAMIVSVMTLYKTLCYVLVDFAEGGKYTRHNTLFELSALVIAPLSVWIIVPAIIICQCSRALSVANVPGPSKSRAYAYQNNQQQKQQGNVNTQGKKRN